MLPTMVFIFWAYGMYALLSALSRRKDSGLRVRSPWRRYGWLALLATTGIGLGLAVALANSFDRENQRLKLSGFLGTVWAEGFPDKVERRIEEPPIKGAASGGDQPVYALLHPGISNTELSQGKTAPKPRPAHKPKLRKLEASQAKEAKVTAQEPKKEPAASKNKTCGHTRYD